MARKVIVLGAGFSGLSAAAYLSRQGFDVEIIEKNAHAGGRARSIESDGFRFDMGPIWYWLPEVFERFFAHFDSHTSNYYELKRLNPSFRVFTADRGYIDAPSNFVELVNLFEEIEPGSGKKLRDYHKNAARQYRLVMNNIIYKTGNSMWEYLSPGTIFNYFRTRSNKPLAAYIRSLFKDKRLQHILEFPFLFLGADPLKLPGIFNLTNYATIEAGALYPIGGMYSVVEGMKQVCNDFGVDITYNVDVDQLDVLKGKVNSAHIGHRNFYGEYFVSSADYYHTDKQLLSGKHSNYSTKQWERKVIGPSALVFYLGVNTKLPNLLHHNVIINTGFDKQLNYLRKNAKWPEVPSFIVSVASKTDQSIAPEGCENLVVIIPVASGLSDSGKVREHYYNMVIGKLNEITGLSISEHIVYHKSYAHTDFSNDYHAYRGNAYGLASTKKQVGSRRPKVYNKKLPNLFYTGQFCVPGPGVPTSVISGEIVAREIFKVSGGKKS